MASEQQDLSPAPAAQDDFVEAPLTPQEEATLLAESTAIKTSANALFAAGAYRDAFNKYHQAFITCPQTCLFDLAVLHSNISACHLKLEEWEEAIKSATSALDSLETLENPKPPVPADDAQSANAATGANIENKTPTDQKEEEEEVDEEIISVGAQSAQPLPAPPLSRSKADIHRIRCKALLRRARARSAAAGWQNLIGAEEDYKQLAGYASGAGGSAVATGGLSPADQRAVAAELKKLPPRIKDAQDKEMAEMWGKLKGLGNGLLRPFGLSTDNFQMVKDENTGGYSMNFKQNP